MVKNLRLLREERGLSQQKLADLLGITQQAVYKYEKLAIEPDILTLIQIADIFNVSVDFLIGRSDIRQVAEPVIEVTLTAEEADHINIWRGLPKNVRKDIDNILKKYNISEK